MMSETERQRIVAAWRKGMTVPQLARLFRRAEPTIAGIVAHAAQHRPLHGEKDMALALQMVRDGTPVHLAARTCGVELQELQHRIEQGA